MAYDYYRNSMPGWGTSQFQFGRPPVPPFQPQPSWSGLDFYSAHAINPDPGFYNSIMARAASFGGMGLGHSEARHWHRRVYSGMVPLMQLLPTDIGAAAAYEAYRIWKHNSFLYEPLSADREQQREGLVGMAIAEATRLWQYSGRTADAFGLRAAAEAAAAAASILADRWLGYSGVGGGLGGISGAPSYASSANGYYSPGYRGRRSSFGSAPGMMMPGSGSPYQGGSPYLNAGGISPTASPMLGAAGAIGASPMLGGGIGASTQSPMLGAGAGMGAGTGILPPRAGIGMGATGGAYGAAMGLSGAASPYSAMPGPGGTAGVNMRSVPPGPTIILNRPSRHSRHHHHSSGRRRSRSVDVVQTGGAGYGGGYGGAYGAGAGYAGYGGGAGYGGYGGGYASGMYGGNGTGGYGAGGYGAGGYGAGGYSARGYGGNGMAGSYGGGGYGPSGYAGGTF